MTSKVDPRAVRVNPLSATTIVLLADQITDVSKELYVQPFNLQIIQFVFSPTCSCVSLTRS